jgi:hypothetical protein
VRGFLAQGISLSINHSSMCFATACMVIELSSAPSRSLVPEYQLPISVVNRKLHRKGGWNGIECFVRLLRFFRG